MLAIGTTFCGIIMYEAANRRTQQEKFLRSGKEGFLCHKQRKRALEASLKKLLLEKPLNKITINDITEDCGVNRMTFYYHFKDIYDLVDWILTEDAVKAMEGRQSF